MTKSPMTALNKQALREAAIHAQSSDDWGYDDDNFHDKATPDAVLMLLDELEALQSFRTAFNEWHDKTEWVQGNKRLDVIKPWGKHRADVLKLYIDHLESKLEAAEKRIAELEERTVVVKQFDDFQIVHYGGSEDYAKGYIDCQNNYNKALAAAGIGVKGE
ncbi:TPA: hypothetical protein ROF92_002634 [Citrobacter freundii]|nr:hypothetical protein [Citrobacter freundii]